MRVLSGCCLEQYLWAVCMLPVYCLGAVWGNASELLGYCLRVLREPFGCCPVESGIQSVCCLSGASDINSVPSRMLSGIVGCSPERV